MRWLQIATKLDILLSWLGGWPLEKMEKQHEHAKPFPLIPACYIVKSSLSDCCKATALRLRTVVG
jgi:hypothetical protein